MRSSKIPQDHARRCSTSGPLQAVAGHAGRHARLAAALAAVVLAAGCATPPGGTPAENPAADSRRVASDLRSRAVDLDRLARAPAEFEGKNIVLYGVVGGEARKWGERNAVAFATPEGKVVSSPAQGSAFTLAMTDDFSRKLAETGLLAPSAKRTAFVECVVEKPVRERVLRYPCNVVGIIGITPDGERATETVWRGADRTLQVRRW